MADAWCATANLAALPASVGTCPSCSEPGRQDALLTVQAQVAISLRELVPSPYQFCATPGCEVVYYTAGSPPITRD